MKRAHHARTAVVGRASGPDSANGFALAERRNRPVIQRITAVTAALAIGVFLSSCSSPRLDNHPQLTNSDTPRITGVPASYDADDLAFVDHMILHHDQGNQLSAMVPDHSVDSDVIGFAAKTGAALESHISVLRVLRVQWNENPDTKAGGGQGAALMGMADDATVAKLSSLHGSQFDTLWLQTMTVLDQGAVEMAKAEVSKGKNTDAIGLAKQIIKVEQDRVGEIGQMLGR